MATVKFHLKKKYQPGTKPKQLRTDEVTIIALFSEGRAFRFEITTQWKIVPKHWDNKSQQVKSTFRGHYEINAYLQEFKLNLLKLYRDNQKLPFDKFKALAQEKPSEEKKTLFIALDKFLKQYEAEKDSKTLGKYNVMAKQLRAYNEINSIDFHNLDHNFYDKFKTHLYEIPNPNYTGSGLTLLDGDTNTYHITDGGTTIGLFDDTVYKYIVNLKTFLAWSEKRGHQVNHSYKGWEIIERHYEPITLDLDELERLENFDFTIESVKEYCRKGAEVGRVARACDIARDYLVFECRTGQRISDIKRFDLKDYSDFKWTFAPRKGNRLSSKIQTVYFKGYCAPALNILAKYNWKMPVVSEQKINDNIKTACKVAGINQEIITYRWAQNKRIKISGPKFEFMSTHCGRRSFVTIALQHMPYKIVKDLAGIESWATLKHYEGSSDPQNIEDALDKVPTNKNVMRKAN